MSNPTVAIILSTYNGSQYLPDFLRSLEAQTCRPNSLVWRDDGSVDETPQIVRQWAQKAGIRLQVLEGHNVGAARSFLTSIAAAESADVVMLADQDDVWLPEKIARAVAALQDHNNPTSPALYAARLQNVDRQLVPISLSAVPTNLDFESTAYESVLTGCTMAFNKALHKLLRIQPSGIVGMHDWWIHLIASTTGIVIYDKAAVILYRQHGGNVIGAAQPGIKGLRARWQMLRRAPARIRSSQIAMLIGLHAASMKPEALALARMLVEGTHVPTKRLRAAFTVPIRRQSFANNLTTRVAILLNRF